MLLLRSGNCGGDGERKCVLYDGKRGREAEREEIKLEGVELREGNEN